jgi:potassium-transporting ATPase KdpC subunit
MLKELKPAVIVLLLLTIITGVVYPMAVTGMAQLLFDKQANGSLIEREGKTVGSALIGQPFSDPKYFWGRPSATSPYSYNAAASSGSNQGPTNPDLVDAVKARAEGLRAADPERKEVIPVDLVTTSASGLDPNISPAAAEYQVARVAQARALSTEAVRKLVAQHTEKRQFWILGEPRVNVLALNLSLDWRQ